MDSSDEKMKNNVRRGFIMLCVVVSFMAAGYFAVLALQSSINIEGGTGKALS